MGSDWTSERAIIRDLTVAQGRRVPVPLRNVLAMGERPPAPHIVEETEEEYFKPCTVSDFTSNFTSPPPDLHLIQEMLDMVNSEETSGSGDVHDMEIHLTKSDANCVTLIPPPNDAKDKPTSNKKIKSSRNVALCSIIALNEKEKISNHENEEPLKLMKPNDFMSEKSETIDSLEKVEDWLSKGDHCQITSSKMVSFKPESVNVKRKVLGLTPMTFKKKECKTDQENKVVERDPILKKTSQTYKPSARADEYYKMYLERAELKTKLKDDIWSKAETLIKEVDEKRTAMMAATEEAMGGTNFPDSLDTTKLDIVRLAEPRHRLPKNCLVCQAVNKYLGTDRESSAL